MCERDRDGDRDQGPSKTSTLVPPSSRSLIGWWVVCGWLQSPLQQRSAYMGRAAYNSPVDLDWEKLLRSCNRCAFTYTRLSLSLSLQLFLLTTYTLQNIFLPGKQCAHVFPCTADCVCLCLWQNTQTASCTQHTHHLQALSLFFCEHLFFLGFGFFSFTNHSPPILTKPRLLIHHHWWKRDGGKE